MIWTVFWKNLKSTFRHFVSNSLKGRFLCSDKLKISESAVLTAFEREKAVEPTLPSNAGWIPFSLAPLNEKV